MHIVLDRSVLISILSKPKICPKCLLLGSETRVICGICYSPVLAIPEASFMLDPTIRRHFHFPKKQNQKTKKTERAQTVTDHVGLVEVAMVSRRFSNVLLFQNHVGWIAVSSDHLLPMIKVAVSAVGGAALLW
jgi:hypothetical protein